MVLVGLALQVRANWGKLPELSAPDPGWFALSWGLGLLAMLIVPVILREILEAHGFQVSRTEAVGLFYVPLQGKYIPGKVWSLVWATRAYASVGVNWPTALSCLVVLTLLNLISALLVSVSLGSTVFHFPWYTQIVAFVLLILLEPRVFRFGVNMALRVPRQRPVHNTLNLKTIAKLLLLNVTYWLLFGFGYWSLARSLFADIEFTLGHLVAAQAGAFLIALLAFFAPAGLGVREGILTGLLTPIAGVGPAIVLAGSQRLWQISLELPCAVAGWFFLRKPTSLSKIEGDMNSSCPEGASFAG